MTRIEKKEILSDEKTKKVAMQVSTVSIEIVGRYYRKIGRHGF